MPYGNKIYYIAPGTGEPIPPPPPPTECFFILQEDGNFILQEDLVGMIEQECTVVPPNCYFILQEDGYNIEQEDLLSFIEQECEGTPPMITFSLTFTGPWASNHTVNLQYQKNGNLVTLYIPILAFATTSSSLITSTGSVPALIVPTSGVGDVNQGGMPVVDNSISVEGAIRIANTTGIVTIGTNIVSTGESVLLRAFQNAGNAGFNNLVLTYLVA